MDKKRRITWINEAFTKVWGYTPEEAIGRTTKDLLRGTESDLGVVAQLYQTQDEGKEFRGEIINGKFDIISKPGHGCKLLVCLPMAT